MKPALRQLIRRWIWLVLACCLIIDADLGMAAISGGDVLRVDQQGRWIAGGDPQLWVPILGFLFIQGVLIFLQIRLHEPPPIQTCIPDVSHR
jgi:hypothetical protein